MRRARSSCSRGLFFCSLYVLELTCWPLQLDVAFWGKLLCDLNRFLLRVHYGARTFRVRFFDLPQLILFALLDYVLVVFGHSVLRCGGLYQKVIGGNREGGPILRQEGPEPRGPGTGATLRGIDFLATLATS